MVRYDHLPSTVNCMIFKQLLSNFRTNTPACTALGCHRDFERFLIQTCGWRFDNYFICLLAAYAGQALVVAFQMNWMSCGTLYIYSLHCQSKGLISVLDFSMSPLPLPWACWQAVASSTQLHFLQVKDRTYRIRLPTAFDRN